MRLRMPGVPRISRIAKQQRKCFSINTKPSVESRRGVLGLGSIWIVWCGGITTNVTQRMKANFIEQLGLLFEDLLQRSREPSPWGIHAARRV
jgi:hypothetical protein